MHGSTDNLLRIQGLSVTYAQPGGEPIRALNQVSLDLRGGEVLGILGESGCGKSTLANAVLGLLPQHARTESGSILHHDRNLLRLPEPELRSIRGREISMIPQEPALSLNPVMKVGDQIAEVLRAHLPLRGKQRRQRVCELLEEVGFVEPAKISRSYPHQLSGGQRQRIVIAQAIACEPAVLIADEPTSKLDGPLRTEVVHLLSKMRQNHGTAILLISHDLTLIAEFADRAAFMYAGRIVEIGATKETFAHPAHPYTQALLQLAHSSLMPTPGARLHFPKIEGDFSTPATDPEPARSVSCLKYGG